MLLLIIMSIIIIIIIIYLILLDFSKAFDKVSHEKLALKLHG